MFAVLPAAIDPPRPSLGDSWRLASHMPTPLQLCSELCRFLL
jgi:hypothetical protein